jgi:fructoselysine-6-P-deglycase FrlB-like protein
MGRPYHTEIEALQGTYEWASRIDLGALESAVRRAASGPLLVIGSGGSLSAARFAAMLHEAETGYLARPCTPLDFKALPGISRSTSVLVLTAGGSNPDILSAMEVARQSEPQELIALVMRKSSRLARELPANDDHLSVFEFPVPFGKDGYLATNSLLGMVVLLGRAMASGRQLPTTLPQLLGAEDFDACQEQLARAVAACFERRYLIVLHDHVASPGAYDIETRCSEAALAAVQVADLRNFAHGRHQWLAKHGQDTSVLCIRSTAAGQLAKRTLALLPADVPRAEIVVPPDPLLGGAASLLASILVAGIGGDLLGIDPGRPHVPEFGRKLYKLRSPSIRTGNTSVSSPVQRRLRWMGTPELRSSVVDAYSQFQRRMSEAEFGAVVLDYDGTMLGASEKKEGLRAGVKDEINRLLDLGVKIGIATGRGPSARKDLRQAVHERHWAVVLVGYYNGSQIGQLSDESIPDHTDRLDPLLHPAYERLQTLELLQNHCTWTKRGAQLTIETTDPGVLVVVREAAMATAATLQGLRVVWSSHSVDIVRDHVSKTTVVSSIGKSLPPNAEVLCIGDKGAYPGNDFELLQAPFSLSVDEEPRLSDGGWRIAPNGVRGVPALLLYLAALSLVPNKKGVVRFSWEWGK